MEDNSVLLEVKALKKHFPIIGGMLGRQVGAVKAVDGISFDVKKGIYLFDLQSHMAYLFFQFFQPV